MDKTHDTREEAVVVRIAPSPTGYMHVGTVRAALFNYLFARKHGGKFILRIEDTDKARSKQEFEANILESLSWLNLNYDEFYRQSELAPRHREYLKKLVAEDKAYVSNEKHPESGEDSSVIRFRNAGSIISFDDLIRGKVTFDTKELGDFVIAKSFDEPLYHLAVVIDDFDMGVTHVIRGEDHISNTPRQILIQEAIGAPRPKYAHLPLILGSDRSKLSKRNGTVSVSQYRDDGFLPQALANYLALLGWHPLGEQEKFSLEELVEAFSIDRIQKGGAIFSLERLRSLNKEYVREMDKEERRAEILRRLMNEGFEPQVHYEDLLMSLIEERIETFGDVNTMVKDGEFSYLQGRPEYTSDMLHWKKETVIENTKMYLEYLASIIKEMNEGEVITPSSLEQKVMPYAEEKGRGNVLWPFRVALSGKEKSPNPFILVSLLGKEESLDRIRIACEKLS